MEISLLLPETHKDVLNPDSPGRSVNIGNNKWRLGEPFDASTYIPPYVCVSYIWGQGPRVANMIHDGHIMSNHTLPSLAAATENHPEITAIWIDAFCVPTDPVKKKATLESMGYIYANAKYVIVVLTETSWEAIDEITKLDIRAEKLKIDGFPVRPLNVINNDDWIRSIWTYQEVVNSRDLILIGQKSRRVIRGQPFLNQFGHYLVEFCKSKKLTPFDVCKTYPYVAAFEDVILDWIITKGRSAFSVISGMYRRVCHEEANYFHSMVGIITDKPPPRNKSSSISAIADSFLTLCAEKGDYSIIFCSNNRDSRPGLRWRPAAEKFRPVASWASFGDKQRGMLIPGGVILKDMYLLTKTTELLAIDKSTREMLSRFLYLEEEKISDNELARIVAEKLKIMDYTGSINYLLWNEGLFFPQLDLSVDKKIRIWVSKTIRWPFGSPGIAIVSLGATSGVEFIPGVFVGACVNLGPATEVHLLG